MIEFGGTVPPEGELGLQKIPAPLPRREWHDRMDEVSSFGRTLLEAGEFGTLLDVQYFYERPWKWDEEHQEWLKMGKPYQEHGAWEEFLTYLSERR